MFSHEETNKYSKGLARSATLKMAKKFGYHAVRGAGFSSSDSVPQESWKLSLKGVIPANIAVFRVDHDTKVLF